MIENNEVIKVRNRGACSAGYKIPEDRIVRKFAPNEEKEITMGELRKLSFQPGGQYLIENCLIIENEHAVRELMHQVEPEYFYTDKEVQAILERGTMSQFLDCLDFAPQGVIDTIKKVAVQIKLNDVAKRQAIKDKTGFDVTKAIEISEETEVFEDAIPSGRRTAAPDFSNTDTKSVKKRREPVLAKYEVIVKE